MGRSSTLYVGTEDGLRRVAVGPDGARVEAACLRGEAVRAIATAPDDPRTVHVGCGLRGWGLHRSVDGGETAEPVGFEDRWVWGAAFAPDGRLFVGTEPPAVYVSADSERFERLSGLDDLPSRDRWTFFHEPFRAGHVHGFSFHPERPDAVLAGVEHGAVVRSTDGGETWTEALVGADAHRTAVDPADPDRLLVGAGGGLFESRDAGKMWTAIEPLRGKYVHSIAFDTYRDGRDGRDARLLVYADDASSPVHRSDDGGRTWTAVGAGLSPAGPADPLAFDPARPDVVYYAGDGDGGSRLFVSEDGGETWRRLSVSLPKAWRLRAVPGE